MPPLPPTLGATSLPTTSAALLSPSALSPAEARLLAQFAPQHSTQQLAALTALIGQALVYNAQFQVAMRNVEAARALTHQESAARLPVVALQAESKRTSFDNADLDATQREHYSASGIGLDYDLDFFGRLGALEQAAQQRYLGSEHGLAAMRAALIAEVLRAYTLAVASADTWRVLQETDRHQRLFAAYAQRRFELGLSSRDQLELERHAATAQHTATVNAEAQHAVAQRALSMLTGFAPAAAVATTGGVNTLSAAPLPLAALRDLDARILLDRPEIRQAEAELRARNADIGAARAAFFPSIHLTTGVGSVSENLDGLFKSGSRAWTFNPTVNLPIFDGGRNQAQLDAATLRKDAGIAAYAQAIETAFQQVAGALDQQGALEAGAALQSRRQQLQDRRTRALTRRVEQGLQDATELLAEHLRAQDAALAHIDAARELALNRIRLLHAFYGTSFSTNQD
ncbi:MAG: TolC family protein [Duganella sp.]